MTYAFCYFSVSRNNGVPPSPPAMLEVASKSRSSVTLVWPPSQVDGGSPVTSYRLQYHRQFGDWDRIDLKGNDSSHTLVGLRCGTTYQFFMEAINEFGVGERTDTVTASTNGSPPKAPISTSTGILSVNTTSIDINLFAWASGGCDISSFVIEYMKANAENRDNWILVNNNVRLGEIMDKRGATFAVLDLRPSTHYILRITAHNSAGSTVKEFNFTTLDGNGDKVAPEELITHSNTILSTLPAVIISLVFALVMIILVAIVCARRIQMKQSLHEMVVRFSSNTPSQHDHQQQQQLEEEAISPKVDQYTPNHARIRCTGNAYELTETEDYRYGYLHPVLFFLQHGRQSFNRLLIFLKVSRRRSSIRATWKQDLDFRVFYIPGFNYPNDQ